MLVLTYGGDDDENAVTWYVPRFNLEDENWIDVLTEAYDHIERLYHTFTGPQYR